MNQRKRLGRNPEAFYYAEMEGFSMVEKVISIKTKYRNHVKMKEMLEC